MDIKAKINELVDKIKNDEGLRNKFMSDPVKAIEELLGVDLPDDQVKQIAEGVKAKINLDSIGNMFGGLFGRK